MADLSVISGAHHSVPYFWDPSAWCDMIGFPPSQRYDGSEPLDMSRQGHQARHHEALIPTIKLNQFMGFENNTYLMLTDNSLKTQLVMRIPN